MSISKKNILIIGGPDVNSRINLVNNLRADFDFIFAGSSKKIKNFFKDNHYKYIYFNLEPGLNIMSDFFSIFSIIKIINKYNPDIVHTFDTKPCVLGRLAAWICGVKIILGTQPGLGIVYSKNQPYFGKIGQFIYEKMYKLVSSMSDMTIFQNTDDMHLMIRRKIVKENKAKLIKSSGIDTTFYKCNRRLLTRPLLNSQDSVNIILISRILKSKGILDYCELAKCMKKDYPNINFTLVGGIQPPSKDSIGIRKIEEYVGYVDYVGKVEDIKSILKASDIMIFPSSYPEGVPRVLLEGASMGLPLIAYDNVGSNEVVINETNGFLVGKNNLEDLKERLILILNDKNLYNKFSSNSRKIAVSTFDINHVRDQYYNLYNIMLNSKLIF